MSKMRATLSSVGCVGSVVALCGAAVVAVLTANNGFSVASAELFYALFGLSIVFANVRSLGRVAPDEPSTPHRFGVARILLLFYAASCSVAIGLSTYWRSAGVRDVDSFQPSEQLLRELVPRIEGNRARGFHATQELYVSINNLNVPDALAEDLERDLSGRKIHSATELTSEQKRLSNTMHGVAVLEIVGPNFPAWRVAELRFSYGGCSASRDYLYLSGRWIRMGDGWGGLCL